MVFGAFIDCNYAQYFALLLAPHNAFSVCAKLVVNFTTIASMPTEIAPNILLVEDEPAIADTLIYSLGTMGCAVHHVATLALARGHLAHALPALVVLDLGLPDGSGLDLCREIRRTSEVPILMLTAKSDELDRIVGLELGADDYVTKPFSPREVGLRIKTILRRIHTPATAANTTSNAIELDGDRAKFAGAWLDLTRRELHLLQRLLSTPGRIYSRDALLDLVWGQDAESMERTVDTHIKTLRAKLRNVDPTQDIIVTHRGLGYSLQLPEH
jgi:two-component system, OmpR family, catabolic regulation response regulator CreB